MAGGKKKKKPAANPARGFATTSIASKPRPETTESDGKAPQDAGEDAAISKADKAGPQAGTYPGANGSAVEDTNKEQALSPEEFERQLEESELQLLVEKHGAKVKRDSHRQRGRLETDRRLLRGNADTINPTKWLPQNLIDHILDLIKGESRFSASSVSPESTSTGKLPPEEELIARLWTLQQTLLSTGFSEHRVQAVAQYILDISPNISSGGKDYIWGLEEALEWLARECELKELPPYESRPKPLSKGIL